MGKPVGAATLRKRASEGRGSVHNSGEEYKGLFGVRDMSSRGHSFRVWGHKSGRMHEFLSRWELACFFALDWSDLVVDVLDQVGLDLEETMAIAAECGIAHPEVKGAGLVPMSTDLVAVLDPVRGGGKFAIAVKEVRELSKRRVLEKLEIERRYWERRGVPWRIATEREFPRTVFENQRLLYGYRSLDRYTVPMGTDEVAGVLAYLCRELLTCPLLPVARVCSAADERLGLERGSSLVLAWHAVATRRWKVDITAPLKGSLPLSGLSAGVGE